MMNLNTSVDEHSTADFQSGETCRVIIEGEPFEVWENPAVPFGNDRQDLDAYASCGQWEFLWNALVLGAESPPESGTANLF
ncbi:MAG: hypothetical protein P8R42_27990 [Candidatus Binatia bacterium]|nr:hypothetical protein [Candidatus Binatia bacterium]